jgi:hypothetical protein
VINKCFHPARGPRQVPGTGRRSSATASKRGKRDGLRHYGGAGPLASVGRKRGFDGAARRRRKVGNRPRP